MSMRLSLKSILMSLFGFLALVSLGQGFAGLQSLGIIQNRVVDIKTKWMPSADIVRQMQTAAANARVYSYRYQAVETDVDRTAALKEFAATNAGMHHLLTRYEPLVASSEERKIVDSFRQKWAINGQIWSRIVAFVEKERHAEAMQLFQGESRANNEAASALLAEAAELNHKGAEFAAQAVDSADLQARYLIWTALTLAGLVAAGAMALSYARIARPLEVMTSMMSRLAQGDLALAVPGAGRRDEVGAMAAAVGVFKDNMIRAKQLEAETALARAGAEAQRKAAMRELADGFERAVGGIVGQVSSSATQLQDTARTMTTTAGVTAGQSSTVAAAAEEAAANVNTVAAAAEELGASVQEISRQVQSSAGLAQSAMGQADQTAQLVHELSEAAAKIGDVVNLISSIAAQTNLLALNATIEAARAGEAGRGFAVVATEVKELAGQTAKATAEIGERITEIQTATQEAVTDIEAISHIIGEMSSYAAAIAAAMEEQGATTLEITRNVQEAARGTEQVTINISDVRQGAGQTGAAASQVLSAAQELSRHSESLTHEVGSFLANVKAA